VDRPWVPPAWALALSLLLLGPVLLPGYVLTYDMVWVPDLVLRGDFLGLGSSLPRAVPSDAVVAVLDEVVPGMLLQKAVLLSTLVVAGLGAWRLVPAHQPAAQLAASALYVWNPFVAERLGIGHWPLLMAYASLPWLLLTVRRWAAGERAVPSLVLWLGFASLSPAGGVIAALFALVCVGVPGRDHLGSNTRRRLIVTGCVAAALNAPWIAAGALHGSGSLSDSAGVSAFATRGEGDLPPLLTLLGLGGIWNAEVVPASRLAWPGLAALLVVVSLCALGLARWRADVDTADRRALVVAAAAGLVVALAGSVAPEQVGWFVAHVPGVGLVRDGARFVALLAPLLATLFGVGVAAVGAAMPGRHVGVAVATGLVLSPVALLPDAALGLSGQLRPVPFPSEFDTARQALEARREAGRNGDLLVLPFSSYRRPSWNHERRTLDPLGRYFPVNYLASDTLVVSGRSIAGEDPRARRLTPLLVSLRGEDLESALRDEGIAWVVVDREAQQALPARVPAPEMGADLVIHDGDLLTLWEVPGPTARPETGLGTAVLLGAAWLAAIGTLGASLVLAGRRAMRSGARVRRAP